MAVPNFRVKQHAHHGIFTKPQKNQSNPTHFWNNQNNHSTKQDTSLRSKSLFNILHNMIYLVTLLHLLIGYDLQLALSVERILIDSNFFELPLNIF